MAVTIFQNHFNGTFLLFSKIVTINVLQYLVKIMIRLFLCGLLIYYKNKLNTIGYFNMPARVYLAF